MGRWQLLLLLLLSGATRAEPARLAIIIDDIGYNLSQSERAARLPGQFTLAVLPFTPHGQQVAALAQRQGKELMLHLPMSNLHDMPLGKGGLTSGMSRESVVATLHADLASLPPVRGVNNHMGSRLTQDSQTMGWVMAELAARDLYFIDSRTSHLTQAQTSAERQGLRSGKRDVFLDDEIEPAAINFQLERAFQLAHKQGSAVAIGHPYPATLQLLENLEPRLAQANIHLVFASQLARRSNAKPLPAQQADRYCPAPPRFSWFNPTPNVDFSDITVIMPLATFWL